MNKELLSGYIELTKPRILTMVVVTAALGYLLGAKGIIVPAVLFFLLAGVALVTAGAGVLNHYWERDVDALMHRTQNRPLPAGLISPGNALTFGICLVLTGVILLWSTVNLLTAFLGLLSAFLYIVVYTPLKRISWINTTIGAIPGALPPVGGWAAATGELNFAAWVLFGIMFLWQHPHFYAIAWIFRDDYARGGFKMLPVIEPKGTSTFVQIFITTCLLVPVSLMPAYLGITGHIYLYGALFSSLMLMFIAGNFIFSHSMSDARQLLKASVIYLPFLLLVIIVDGIL